MVTIFLKSLSDVLFRNTVIFILGRVLWLCFLCRYQSLCQHECRGCLGTAEILNITSAPADFEVFSTNWHPQSPFYVTLSFKFRMQALGIRGFQFDDCVFRGGLGFANLKCQVVEMRPVLFVSNVGFSTHVNQLLYYIVALTWYIYAQEIF